MPPLHEIMQNPAVIMTALVAGLLPFARSLIGVGLRWLGGFGLTKTVPLMYPANAELAGWLRKNAKLVFAYPVALDLAAVPTKDGINRPVVLERLMNGTALWRWGWWPLLVRDASGQQFDVTYIRGTFDPRQFLCEVAAARNTTGQTGSLYRNLMYRVKEGCSARRFNVTDIRGTNDLYGRHGGRQQGGGGVQVNAPPTSQDDDHTQQSNYILGANVLRTVSISEDQIGMSDKLPSTDDLWMSPDVRAVFQECEAWLANGSWFRDRLLQWKRNFMFYGGPGTGKTCSIRAIGAKLDLPIFRYDLASLTNSEFQQAWQHHSRLNSPCIMLMEDIDAVFEGRKNVSNPDAQIPKLSFDCLLNTLDGVDGSDGYLVFITTNKPAMIDEALATCKDDVLTPTRPGRVDRTVKMRNLDFKGRRKIAQRVLAGESEDLVYQFVNAGDGESGAVFTERCRTFMLEKLSRTALHEEIGSNQDRSAAPAGPGVPAAR